MSVEIKIFVQVAEGEPHRIATVEATSWGDITTLRDAFNDAMDDVEAQLKPPCYECGEPPHHHLVSCSRVNEGAP